VRLAIISDIHSNLEALTSVLDHIRERQAHSIVCLGDVVGYGANPLECLRLIRDNADFCVLGNHDAAVLHENYERAFNPTASKAIEWTLPRLDEEAKLWLRSLPYRISRDDMLFVHSSPHAPEQWEYIFSGLDARRQGEFFSERLCFIGHSHTPFVFPIHAARSEYDSTNRFIINVGSVGQPRDGDWRSSYGILDTVAGTYENCRVEYDVDLCMRKIRDAGLPQRLADRLRTGM